MSKEFIDIVLYFYILFAISISMTSSKPCTSKQPCTCSTGDYDIDLINLMIYRKNVEFHTEVSNYNYFLHPCNNSPAVCKNNITSGCQISKPDAGLIFPIAQIGHNLMEGDPDNGSFNITNTANGDRKSILIVICDTVEGDFSFVIEAPLNNYVFTLKTRYGCPPKNTKDGGLSVGSILVILFFVLLLIYLVGGVLFLKFVRKAEGAEAIPNVEFWKDLPSLIKDGMVFTFRGCKAESTYEKI